MLRVPYILFSSSILLIVKIFYLKQKQKIVQIAKIKKEERILKPYLYSKQKII